MRHHHLLLLLALLVWLLVAPAPAADAQAGERCFPETGHCISGRIRQFWEQNGGLPVFGFPLGPQTEELIEGRRLQVQRFERNRLELHPENARPYDVLLGRLGADRLAQQGRDWRSAFPPAGPQPGCRFFPETGHSVCGRILEAWRASGLEFDGRPGISEAESLALFGLPLSGLVSERLSDGRTYQVQWFERARFELHPENSRPYDVLLGRLGDEIRGGPSAPPAQPAPTPVPPAPTRLPDASRPGACLSDEEAELVRLINEYRAASGLPPVPVSRSLTTVAQLHVRDLQEHRPNSGSDGRGLACNLHSWSSNGPWTPVCYTADHTYASGMWDKPREITGGVYSGTGYENAFASYGAPATAAAALASWQASPGHSATILERGTWASASWPAMGVGISENFAVLWFGNLADPQGEIGVCP